LKKGGKCTALIPSSYGYGIQPTNQIPANSVLIFDLELLDFH
jgi:FKBP-type peptidyl-prolyl cis-trans isomerase